MTAVPRAKELAYAWGLIRPRQMFAQQAGMRHRVTAGTGTKSGDVCMRGHPSLRHAGERVLLPLVDERQVARFLREVSGGRGLDLLVLVRPACPPVRV